MTGAAGGIGSCVVERLREAGAKVAVADIDTDSIQAEARLPGDLLDAGYADGLAAAPLSRRLAVLISSSTMRV